MLQVADAELDVGGRSLLGTHEVRRGAEHLGVPGHGGRHVVGEVGDGGKSSQHDFILPGKVLTF